VNRAPHNVIPAARFVPQCRNRSRSESSTVPYVRERKRALTVNGRRRIETGFEVDGAVKVDPICRYVSRPTIDVLSSVP